MESTAAAAHYGKQKSTGMKNGALMVVGKAGNGVLEWRWKD